MTDERERTRVSGGRCLSLLRKVRIGVPQKTAVEGTLDGERRVPSCC